MLTGFFIYGAGDWAQGGIFGVLGHDRAECHKDRLLWGTVHRFHLCSRGVLTADLSLPCLKSSLNRPLLSEMYADHHQHVDQLIQMPVT